MTSLTWLSRQARTQRVQWMQAARLTVMAGWLWAGSCGRRGAKRGVATPRVAHQRRSSFDKVSLCCGALASSSSRTSFCARRARSLSVRTVIPGAGSRLQAGASSRSPSISTTQARQLPSGRSPS